MMNDEPFLYLEQFDEGFSIIKKHAYYRNLSETEINEVIKNYSVIMQQMQQ